jgi:hypothetical protein
MHFFDKVLCTIYENYIKKPIYSRRRDVNPMNEKTTSSMERLKCIEQESKKSYKMIE